MPIKTEEIINLLSQLAEEEKLRVTISESLKAGLIAGTSATIGGVLFGPLGIAFVGTLSSIYAALAAKKFLPVAEVISCMTPENQEVLSQRVRSIMEEISVTDAVPLATLVAGDTALRSRVVGELIEHIRTEMSMSIANH